MNHNYVAVAFNKDNWVIRYTSLYVLYSNSQHITVMPHMIISPFPVWVWLKHTFVFQLCESQRVVILDLGTETQRVEIVNLQPFEDDESREQDLTSSPTNTTTENRFVCGCVCVWMWEHSGKSWYLKGMFKNWLESGLELGLSVRGLVVMVRVRSQTWFPNTWTQMTVPGPASNTTFPRTFLHYYEGDQAPSTA